MNNNSYRCVCGGFHFVTIDKFDPEDPILYIEDAYRVYGSFWNRIKAAVSVLWRGECTLTEIALSPEVAGVLVEEIIKTALTEGDELAPASREEFEIMLSFPRVA